LVKVGCTTSNIFMINNGLERKLLPGKDEKKTRTFSSQGIRCHGRDSNWLSPEYMSPKSPSATLFGFTQYTFYFCRKPLQSVTFLRISANAINKSSVPF